MKSSKDLHNILFQIDGKGYKAYNDIKGQYHFDHYTLSMDHIQGDPFASPSKARVIVSQRDAQIPEELFDKPHKKIAVADFLTRVFAKSIRKYYDEVGGSGKSGLLTIDQCGQQILERTSIVIDQQKVEARFEVGLPAAGRRILGKSASFIFVSALPKIVESSLFFKNIDQNALIGQVRLSEDQEFLRREIKNRGLVSFVANGSILPRESGISDRPLLRGAIPFKSPESLEIEIGLPHRGVIKGMGIPEGITLIAGGGYHGKSTLLNALELSVYNHIAGDGREYIATRENAVKIRAEDGRSIQQANISPFINNLPNNQDTRRFSTENASGSTSQAANIIEALEIGTALLLMDEDTSATNFMIRDGRMQKLVSREKEPITPFIDKVKQLHHDHQVSTVLVVGGSGDYFDVADIVIMMDEYIPKDVTSRAKEIANASPGNRENTNTESFGTITPRVILKSSFPSSYKGVKIKSKGLHTVLYNKSQIDLSSIEQLVDTSQTNGLTVMLKYAMDHLVDDQLDLSQIIDRLYTVIETKGLDAISPHTGHPGNLALPRKYEFGAMVNRYRDLKIR